MTEIGTPLSDRMGKPARDNTHANLRPRDASTLILIDRSKPAPQVLLGRRHHSHKFMPGMFVFPGGRVEADDKRMPTSRPLDPRVEARLLKEVRLPSPDKARGFALAAIRETFEETGLLLGTRQAGALATPDGALSGPWAAFAKAGVLPDLGDIHFIARAITPPRRPRRFDTRFFAVDAQTIAVREDGKVGPDSELVELVWLPIDDAKRLELPPITKAVLEELEARTAAGFSHDLPAPFYRMLHRKVTKTML
jgi:8-oxo-dGTP pyrophosphatase MutT (NUDIX family)